MAFKMRGSKFYGDRSRKDMRQDIREERQSLKDHGGTREDVKDFNEYQNGRKKDIRAGVKDRNKENREADRADRKTEGTRLAQNVRRKRSAKKSD